MGTSDGKQTVGLFRKMLLDVLSDNAGSTEVEKSYLELYRQDLKTLIEESSPRRVAAIR